MAYHERKGSMKYLFLDFDGVLHPTTHGSTLFSKAHLLEDALIKYECSIIISLSWRFHLSLDEITLTLPEGIRHLIQGVTGEPYMGQYARYHEIVGYLYDHDKHFANWRALDDSWAEFPEGCDNLITCNPNTGITKVEIEKLIDWLR